MPRAAWASVIALFWLISLAQVPVFADLNDDQNLGISYPVTITSAYGNGTAIVGMYIELVQNGSDVATGFTPITFYLQGGQGYQLVANNFSNTYFATWSIPQTYSNPLDLATYAAFNLTAYYFYSASQNATGG